MKPSPAVGAGLALALFALTGCGLGQPTASATPARPSAPASTATPSAPPPPTPTATPPPTPAPVVVPDFQVVAYQGDQTFGGHDGHFSAAFASGKPVVLLYFAGL